MYGYPLRSVANFGCFYKLCKKLLCFRSNAFTNLYEMSQREY